MACYADGFKPKLHKKSFLVRLDSTHTGFATQESSLQSYVGLWCMRDDRTHAMNWKPITPDSSALEREHLNPHQRKNGARDRLAFVSGTQGSAAFLTLRLHAKSYMHLDKAKTTHTRSRVGFKDTTRYMNGTRKRKHDSHRHASTITPSTSKRAR